MYDQLFTDLQTRLQPALELAETNKQTLEKLIGVQRVTTHELVNAGLEQFKALVQCQDPKSALEIQVKFYKALEAKLTDTAAKSVAILGEAKQAYASAVEASSKKAVVEVEAAVKKAA